MVDNFSRLFAPYVDQKESEAIAHTISRSWLGLGPSVSRFESEWKEHFCNSICVATNSGTAALHLALLSNHFELGKKVLVPDITFIASASAAIYCGLEPVFVDIDESTISLTVEALEASYTEDVVAVVVVHYAGHPAPMEDIMEWSKSRNVIVIEDCAHTSIVKYKGKLLGTWGDYGCFSFEEKKILTTGDGGMIVCKDQSLESELRALRWVGIDKDTWKAASVYSDRDNLSHMHWYYEISHSGYKYNMNDVAASIGLVQLSKYHDIAGIRRDLVRHYLECLSKCSVLQPCLPYDSDYVYQIFAILTPDKRKTIIKLKEQGIASGCHYTPLHLHPLFSNRCNSSSFQNSENIYNRLVTLPLHPWLTKEDMEHICISLLDIDQYLVNTST